MTDFTTFKRDNPCPICKKNDGRCKEKDSGGLILCMTLTEAVNIPGYKYRGLSDGDGWGMWAIDDGRNYSPEEWEQFKRDREIERASRERLERERRAASMPADERDRHYRKLLPQLTLHPSDRKDLHRRGFTDEQIERIGFKSVEQWQKLKIALPTNLPGVLSDGRSLNVSEPGYLCPVRDAEGRILTCQIRSRGKTPDKRYYWLTSRTDERPEGATSHLSNGELPLAVYHPSEVKKRAIALVEGTGPKPAITAESLGIVTIGAAGAMFASSPETLRHTLTELDAKAIEFYPDAGSTSNAHVMRQYRNTLALLEQWGYEPRIAWWGQTSKESGDIDEMKQHEKIQYITVSEFESIVQQQGNDGENSPKPVKVSRQAAIAEKQDLRCYGKDGEPKPLPQSAVATILSEEYRERLAWNASTQSFYRYEGDPNLKGVWSEEDEIFVSRIIRAELDSRGASGLYSASYIKSIRDIMQIDLAVKNWDEVPGLLPMQNGVLDLNTKKLLPYSPGYHFTWQLPYEYNPLATCEPIKAWLLEVQDNDPQRVDLLQAFLKAVLTSRNDFQRYLELVGPGGTGKSTAANIAVALVGLQNTVITSFEQLEKNRFETSQLKGKKLILINDSSRYGGDVPTFKAITGCDLLRNEQKFKQQSQPFVARAMAIVVANEPIASTDYTSGLERRRLTVPFMKKTAPSKRRDLLTITPIGVSGEFVEFLPGLLNWVLAMPDEEMRQLILETSIHVPSLGKWKAETLIETNPIAAWLEDCCLLSPELKTYIGVADEQRETSQELGIAINRKSYRNSNSWLYANYCQFSQSNGTSPVKVQRFSRLLLDLVNNQLQHDAAKGRDNAGSYIRGIGLRGDDKQTPRPITGESLGSDGFSDGFQPQVLDRVTVESTGSDGFDGCVDYFSNQFRSEKVEGSYGGIPPTQKVDSLGSAINSDEKPSKSSKSTLPSISAVTNTNTVLIESPQKPTLGLHRKIETLVDTPIKVGNRVQTPSGAGIVRAIIANRCTGILIKSEETFSCTLQEVQLWESEQ